MKVSLPGWVGGLAHLSDISPSLRNSDNMKMQYVHMRGEPARLGGIPLDFASISRGRWDENFSNEQVQVGQPGDVG